ncbi:DUF3888 domain-containing protein [Bacillus sp. FJAT-53711]|uniref:DUF3888 domain-containing protein n=1 Tax=Bacillus yunxiaonensis TaxID=3127665 RepID=A0ABU8FWR7_9BACI
MKKICCFILSCFILLGNPASFSAEHEPLLLEDALYSVLFPRINEAIQKHYGKQKPYDCPKIVSMKKMYSGTYLFRTSIEIIKYEPGTGGRKLPPFEKVTITFDNDSGEWTVKNIDVKRLPDDTKINCRKPI